MVAKTQRYNSGAKSTGLYGEGKKNHLGETAHKKVQMKENSVPQKNRVIFRAGIDDPKNIKKFQGKSGAGETHHWGAKANDTGDGQLGSGGFTGGKKGLQKKRKKVHRPDAQENQTTEAQNVYWGGEKKAPIQGKETETTGRGMSTGTGPNPPSKRGGKTTKGMGWKRTSSGKNKKPQTPMEQGLGSKDPKKTQQ